MKRFILLTVMALSLVLQSCTKESREGKHNVSEKSGQITRTFNPETDIKSDIMTPEVLWSMRRIGEFAVSPDNKSVIYTVTDFNIEKNGSKSSLYIINMDGTGERQLAFTECSVYNPVWYDDNKIAFLSAESGRMQVWMVNADGSDKRQITDFPCDVNGFKFSPDGDKILYCAEVHLKAEVKDIYPDLPLSTGRINNDLMYRHWDRWVDTFSHLFYAKIDGELPVKQGKDIMEGEMWEAPIRPFGGMEQVSWSRDGGKIFYSCRKKIGKEYAVSTNADIYQYEIATGKCLNLTEKMMGYDLNLSVSPSGSGIAWESMERDGYEADKQRLFVMNLISGEKRDLSAGFDQNAGNIVWADDNTIYFISDIHATDQIYSLNVSTKEIKKITDGVHNYVSLAVAGDKLIAGRQSMSHPTELYVVDPLTGEQRQLTRLNDDIFAKLTMGKVEERWIKTTDNKDMLVWVVYPPHFDANKKYPTLLYCEGGPQSTVSQFWSYRWNFQMMAANGYVVVAPNRRGLPGFGQEWNEAISGDYGGQCMKDYLKAIDELAKEPFVDSDRLGAVGASFGGFSVYWLAGNHEKRFKAFIAHDGMFNFEAQYLETEEMWFVNWDLGGAFWEKDNAVAQRSYANSPHKFVDKWDTPIFVIHGGKDYRICYTQGMQAYNAAVLRGIPAEFLYFPDENHWVLKPQNGILWQRRFYNWLDTYLK